MWTAFLVIFQITDKKDHLCRVCAKGAARKYVKCFQTATSWWEVKLGVKVYFDVWASRGAWESPRAQGGGVPRGISRGCLIESFYLWSQPHLWIHGAAVEQTNAVSQGNHGRKEGFITQCADLGKNTSSSVQCLLFSNGKPGGGGGGYEGITKITKKTLRLSWELQGRLKKQNFNADLQITRSDTAVSKK